MGITGLYLPFDVDDNEGLLEYATFFWKGKLTSGRILSYLEELPPSERKDQCIFSIKQLKRVNPDGYGYFHEKVCSQRGVTGWVSAFSYEPTIDRDYGNKILVVSIPYYSIYEQVTTCTLFFEEEVTKESLLKYLKDLPLDEGYFEEEKVQLVAAIDQLKDLKLVNGMLRSRVSTKQCTGYVSIETCAIIAEP